MFFVALAAQGQDGEAGGLGKLKERAGDGREPSSTTTISCGTW